MKAPKDYFTCWRMRVTLCIPAPQLARDAGIPEPLFDQWEHGQADLTAEEECRIGDALDRAMGIGNLSDLKPLEVQH